MVTIKGSTTRTATTLARASVAAILVVGLMAGTAFAGKGGAARPPSGGSGSSLAVAMTTDLNGNGTPNWGEKIRFTFSTSEPYPIVTVTCTVGGVMVGADSKPYYWPNVWNDPGDFTLSSLAWAGGPADCVGALKGQSRKGTVTLATTSFHVDG